jgi:hypothetical protein
MQLQLRPGDRVEFGPLDRPLSGEVSAITDEVVTVIVDDFMGRRVPFTITDPETIRRVPAGLVRRSG